MQQDPLSVRGRTALITGGNRGIGYGMAQALAQAGADVTIWGRDSARNEAAVERLLKFGTTIRAASVDVSEEESVVNAMTDAAMQMGGLDMVVANAAIGGSGAGFLDISLQEFRQLERINLEGAFLTLREGARQMIARGCGGSLVAVTSFAVQHGARGNQAYAATKAGVLAMTKGCAVEFARFGIRCNAVMPGYVETEMAAEMLEREVFRERVLPRVPLRRWGKPEDFGGVIVYLLSDASRYHTGDSLRIDGGYVVF